MGFTPIFLSGMLPNIQILVRSDLEIVRSRIKGSLFSTMWKYLAFLSLSHLPG